MSKLTRDDWSYEEHVNSVEEPLGEKVFWAKVDQFNAIINIDDLNDHAANKKIFELSQELGV